MSKNASNAEKDEVSPGTIVRSPTGREWVVIDPVNLPDDLPTSTHYWLGEVAGDESRGCGKETFRQEGWEVLD